MIIPREVFLRLESLGNTTYTSVDIDLIHLSVQQVLQTKLVRRTYDLVVESIQRTHRTGSAAEKFERRIFRNVWDKFIDAYIEFRRRPHRSKSKRRRRSP